MSVPAEVHIHIHLLGRVRSFDQIYSHRIPDLDHPGHIHYWASCHRHQSAEKVGDGASVVGVGGILGSVKKIDRKIYHWDDGDYSCRSS